MESKDKRNSEQQTAPGSTRSEFAAELGTTESRASEIGKRIVRARGEEDQKDFARALGVHSNTLGRYERGERLPDSEFLIALAAKRRISTEWVLLGVPPMTLEGIDARLAARADAWSASLAEEMRGGYDVDKFVLVPLYDVRAAAGHGALVEDRPPSDHWAFSRTWLASAVGVPVARLALVTVAGNSMEPDLHDGDVVMIDRGDVEQLREGVYVFRLDDHVYVKELRLLDGRLAIISRNDGEFPRQEVSSLQENSTFRLLGRVIGQPTFRRF